MLHILWLIIKFILIILGIAGALLLSVLLLLLFCPVRYLIQGSKPEEGGMSGLKGQIRVSWLFRGITFRLFYENKETKTDFRIFGISADKFRRRKKKASGKSARPEEKISDENISAEKELPSLEKLPFVTETKEKTEIPKVQEKAAKEKEEKREEIQESEPEKKKPGLLKGFMDKIKSIPAKIRKIRLTIKRTCVKIEWWLSLIHI